MKHRGAHDPWRQSARRTLRVMLAAGAITNASTAHAADTEAAAPAVPDVWTSPAWLLFQLIPSSDIVIWEGTVRYGARWQVTPLLYSFGANRKLSRWHAFVVEPILRTSGSLELYLAPEVLTGSFAQEGARGLLRGGVRSYFPVIQRGEYLALSAGASAFGMFGPSHKVGAAADVGVHTFGGLFGLRLGYSPTPGLRMTTITLELRVF